MPRCIPSAVSIIASTLLSSAALGLVGSPANDDCANAEPLMDTVTGLIYDTTGATTDGPLGPDACLSMFKDIWYCYTPSISGLVTVDTNGSTFDTVLGAYEGCDTNILLDQAIKCSDDGGEGDRSLIRFPVVAGQSYKLRVGGWLGDSGVGTLNISLAADVNGNEIPDALELPGGPQWSSYIMTQTSEFNATGAYSAERALGAADVSVYGDSPNAWCPANQNGTIESLTLGLATPVFADGFTIRQNWGAGSVIAVNLIEEDDGVVNVFSGIDPSPSGELSEFCRDFAPTDERVKAIQVVVDTDATEVWEEIDSVEVRGAVTADAVDCNLNGLPDDYDISEGAADCNGNGIPDSCDLSMLQWGASIVDQSSEWDGSTIIDGFPAYSAEQALGFPDNLAYRDHPRAWSPTSKDGTNEFIIVRYAIPMFADAVTVRRTWGVTAATTGVDLLRDDGTQLATYDVFTNSPEGEIANLRINFPRTAEPVAQVRVRIDTDDTPLWEEIDAVGLHGVLEMDAPGDCDDNGIPDDCDLIAGVIDCNVNMVPDICEFEPAYAASVVDATTEWSSVFYAASMAVGPPDVFAFGDNPLAWSPRTKDGTRETLTVDFNIPGGTVSRGIVVRETWGVGATFQIDLIDTDGAVHTMWAETQGAVPADQINELTVTWPETDFNATGARIHVNTDYTSDWEEIDAIELLIPTADDCDGNGIDDTCDILVSPAMFDCNLNGIPDECELGQATIWASRVVSQTSEFNETGPYSAEQMLGGPDVFAEGDSPNAWCASTRNGSIEELVVEFDVAIIADAVTVRQNWGAGAIVRIDLLDSVGDIIDSLLGFDPGPPGILADLRLEFLAPVTPVQSVRIFVDLDATEEWEEIDAVALHGAYEGATDLNGNGTPDTCE